MMLAPVALQAEILLHLFNTDIMDDLLLGFAESNSCSIALYSSSGKSMISTSDRCVRVIIFINAL